MKTLAIIIALAATSAHAETQCQVFSDGQIVCFPIGGGSTYGR